MPRYFDEDLPRINADKLKPMVKIWGGASKMRKEECVAFITSGLKDPQKVQAALSGLAPWERNALAFVKLMGGVIPSATLKIGILVSGLHPPRSYNDPNDFLKHLFRRGLILVAGPYGPDSIDDSYGYSKLFYPDERLLAQVGQPEYLPLAIQSTPARGRVHCRHASEVALDVMGMLQTVQNIGGLKLTQNGVVRANDENKLRKAMHWDENGADIDGFLFPKPAQTWLNAFSYSDLIQKTDNGQLILKESPEQFANRSFDAQIRLLLEGFLRIHTWWEIPDLNTYLDQDGNGRNQGRLALSMALEALSPDNEAFYSIVDFEKAFYLRVGEDFALGYPPRRPYFYRYDNATAQKKEFFDWHKKTRSDWLKQEFPWLVGAFSTWLYFLGLVELFVDKGKLIGFRLTDLGRAVFHPELSALSPEGTKLPTSGQPAWVVQPNFDLIAYLDRVNTSQFAFLERCAERTKSHKHTAHYRLTRESIYRGLESGNSIEEIITTLQTGSKAQLPQNILVELREWASLRERITVHRKAKLIEFSTPEALQAALPQGLTGTIIAERFLLLKSSPPTSGWTTINYANTLPQNLIITETGMIHWKSGSHDLITASQLSQWADATDNDGWQLTRESITNALRPGRKITELLTLLNNRIISKQPAIKYAPPVPAIPPLLELALRSWAGKEYQVELEAVIILRCPQELVFRTILGSTLFHPFLKGYQNPDLLFVLPEQLEALRERLNWLGWKVSDNLQVVPLK